MRLREYCGRRADSTLSRRTPQASAVSLNAIGETSNAAESPSSNSDSGKDSVIIGFSIGLTAQPIGYNHLLSRCILAKSHANQIPEIRRHCDCVFTVGMQFTANRKDR